MKFYMKKTAFIKNKNVKYFFIALFVAIGLSLSLNIFKDAQLGISSNTNKILKLLIKLEKSFNKNTFYSMVIFGFTYLLLYIRKSKEKDIFKNILALLFSAFTVLGYSYSKTNSWNLIFGGKFQFFKAIIVAISYFIIFKLIIDCLFEYIIPKIKYKASNNKIFNFIFEKHSFLVPLVIILLCWLPYVILFYPGVLMSDSSNQIKQYFGMEISDTTSTNSVKLLDENVKITNHHPVLHTFILGTCLNIGRKLINDNFGIFIYTFLQLITLAVSFAYIINFMKKLKTNNYIRVATLLLFALFPIFPFYAMEITKDVPYTSVLIIYICQLYKIIKNYNNKKMSNWKVASIITISILVCLLRNNGLYSIILSLPFVAIFNKVNRKRILFITVFVFIFYELFLKVLLPICKIPNTGVREMLSVPLQQTARYVKQYDKEITDEEKEVIDKLLNYKTLATRYVPERSDAVKNEFNKDATSEDLKNYFKIWFKQFFKHPNVYFESFINNYYGYFYLEEKTVEYTAKYIEKCDEKINKNGDFKYSYNKMINGRKAIKEYLNISKKIPVISWVTNLAINNWIILLIICYLLYIKKYKEIVFILPSLVTVLVCLISPVNAYFRYSLPNIFAIPLIISIFLDIISKDKEEFLDEPKNCSNNTML